MQGKKFITHAVSVFLILVTLVCIFTPALVFLKYFTTYTLFIMLALLAAGLGFFVTDQQRLMMISLLCCGVLCLHLKASSNKQMRLAVETSNPSIRISHVSLGNAESDYNAVIDYLLNIKTDIFSFQELTPDWSDHLKTRLSPTFHYVETLTRLDQYGMGFFSKYPFISTDTFYYQDIPNLTTTVLLGENKVCNIVSSQVTPPVSQAAFAAIAQHFIRIRDYLDSVEGTHLVLGDFHLPPWSSEVQKFKESGKLQDSRRDMHPRNLDGSLSLPRIPVEHILFSQELECTSFSEIGNSTIGRIGISGSYQLQQQDETDIK